MRRLLRDITLLLTLLLCGAGGGWADSAGRGQLSGDIRLGAASYAAEVDGKQSEEAAHLYQQYSVQYRHENSLVNGRAGAYTLLLGYEHTVLNPSFTHNNVADPDADTMTRDKLFYQGKLTVAPGGLPFRLQLWTEDLQRSAIVTSSLGALPLGDLGNRSHGHLFDADTFGDIHDGTHQVYGATLLVGIRNGSYLGAYRDVLSQLPRLLIDFRQEDVEDTSSRFSPTKYRQRDLAFISLNKKDNWVHFRMHDYINFLQPDDNSKETQVLIGTIDHTRKREWINLTNWLKISTDGSYTVYKQANLEIPSRTYAYNLFAIGRREGRQLSILSNFQRTTDRSGLKQIFDLPVQTTIDLDRNTRISTRLLANAEKWSSFDADPAASLVNSDPSFSHSSYDLFLETRAELNRSGHLLYRPRLQAERHTQTGGEESIALKLGGEVATNSQLSKANDWLAGFDLATVQTRDAESEESAFSQLDLHGRFDRNAGRNWRYGSRVELGFGVGDAQAGASALRIPVLSEGGGSYDPLTDNFNGEVLQSRLSLYGEHRAAQWGNRLEFTHELRAQAGVSEEMLSIEHALQRDEQQSHFEWRSSAEFGDSAVASGFNGDYLRVAMLDTRTKMNWRSAISYDVSPNRQMFMSYRGELNGTSEQTFYQVGQELGYTIFTRNGVVRRLAACKEEFSYERLAKGDGLVRTGAARLKLSAGYYPTHSYYLIGTTEYVLLQPSAATIYVLTANTGFNFQQLKLNLSYSLGNKSEESLLLPDVVERRWSVDVTKIF